MQEIAVAKPELSYRCSKEDKVGIRTEVKNTWEIETINWEEARMLTMGEIETSYIKLIV